MEVEIGPIVGKLVHDFWEEEYIFLLDHFQQVCFDLEPRD